MIYVMSDIHGCYDKYLEMLKLINFNENDKLYILGDVCDRGVHSMKILLHMMEQDNIIPIYGNHDVDALIHLEKIMNNTLEENRDYLFWLADGGKSTLNEFMNLKEKDKLKVINYLSDFRYYDNVIVNDKEYVLVHGGLGNFNISKSLEEYSLLELVNDRLDYDKVYYPNKIIISGHTPTIHIDRNMKGKIIKKHNHIAIDCGCVFGYGLGCICLNNMKEYYV